MNALFRKEARLMLPAWSVAVSLCSLPLLIGVIISMENPGKVHVGFALYTVPIACAILGLTTFGREFSAGTFSLLLAQPCRRRELWNAKMLVLTVAALSVLLVVALTSLPFVRFREGCFLVGLSITSVMVATSGALWTTLLLRQFVPAFWLSLLMPLAITLLSGTAEDETRKQVFLIFALMAYSIGSFMAAKKLFLNAQDTAWTGGTLTLPTLGKWLPRTQTAGVRKFHPLVALLRKEFQFQQMSLVLGALLFVANVAVLLCKKTMTVSTDSHWNLLFDGFWVLWLLMPLMIGCTAVAEERRLGTLEPQLCLPVSRTKQFIVKLVAVLGFAILLGVIPLVLSHLVGLGLGLKGVGAFEKPDGKYVVTGASLIISLLAFYASTLCRQFLQAIGATIGCIVALILLGNWVLRPAQPGGEIFWQGGIGTLASGLVCLLFSFSLLSWRGRWRLFLGLICLWVLLVLAETLVRGSSTILVMFRPARATLAITIQFAIAGPILLLLVLAFRNFCHVHTGTGLALKNSGVWLVAFLLTTVVATAAYHRVWEIGMRFEPPPGQPRLSGTVRPMIAKYYRSGWLMALLPDGRLWAIQEYETKPVSGTWTGNEVGWRVDPIKNPRGEFISSNWLCMAMSLYDGTGVKAGGSLWTLTWWESVGADGESIPANAINWSQKDRTLRQTPVTTTRVGSDSDWVMTAAGGAHYLALKRDGTLWGWGDNHCEQLGSGLPKTVSAPFQLGTDSDWEFIVASASETVAVKRDHSVWKWGQAYPITSRGIGKAFIGGTPQKIATLPGKVSRIVSSYYSDVFFCEDGSAWGLGQVGENFMGTGNQFQMMTELQKLWSDGKWAEIESESAIVFAAIQKDGSLWRKGDWRTSDYGRRTNPEQVGERKDWIAVRSYGDTVLAMAKDGTLCRFGDEEYGYSGKLFAPPRRVTWSVNMLEAAK